MSLVPEKIFPEYMLDEVLEHFREDDFGEDPRVRHHPFALYALHIKEDGAWDPEPESIGAAYLVTEGDTDNDIRILMHTGNEIVLLNNAENIDGALLGAISWTRTRDVECNIRLLKIPGGNYTFWARDGGSEVFFPAGHGHLVSGPEFAASLKAIADGIETTDWNPWDIPENDDDEE